MRHAEPLSVAAILPAARIFTAELAVVGPLVRIGGDKLDMAIDYDGVSIALASGCRNSCRPMGSFRSGDRPVGLSY